MFEGSLKYGRHNYRATPVRSSVYFDAMLRHAFAWWEGEDNDPDNPRVSHITKAIATLTVLRDAMLQGKLIDDRPPPAKPFMEEANRAAAILVQDYGGRDVKHYTKDDVT